MSSRLMSALGILAVAGSLAACNEGTGPNADASALALAKGSSPDNRIEILLAGSADFPEADGKARFRDRGGERELQIGVEDGPSNVQVSFLVAGAEVATATTDSFGDARINLNTDRGDDVPTSVAGATVEVVDEAGAVIVSGTFGS